MWSRVHFLKLAHIVFRSSLFCDLRLLFFLVSRNAYSQAILHKQVSLHLGEQGPDN